MPGQVHAAALAEQSWGDRRQGRGQDELHVGSVWRTRCMRRRSGVASPWVRLGAVARPSGLGEPATAAMPPGSGGLPLPVLAREAVVCGPCKGQRHP